MFHIESDDIALRVLPCPARVWKVRPEPFSQQIALELRDDQQKSVSFAVVSGDKEELKVIPGMEKIDWWRGMEEFREGVLWIHGYQEEGLPLHQGLAAVEVASGKVLWERPEAAFFGMIAAGILVHPEAGGPALELLNIRTGRQTAVFPDHTDAGLRHDLNEYHDYCYAGMDFPVRLNPGEAGYGKWLDRLGATPFGPIAVQERKDIAVVAWHEGSPESGFDLALAVFRDDQLLLDGWLEQGMKGMHPDPFFVHEGRVIAVREQSELVVIRLPAFS